MLKGLFRSVAQRRVLVALFVCLGTLLAGTFCCGAYAENNDGVDTTTNEVAIEASPAVADDTEGGETGIYQSVEVRPEPPGGLRAFMQWVGQQYQMPQAAVDAGVGGVVVVSFVVNRDGKLTGHKVVRDLGYGTGEEAIRVLKTSPRWQPGAQEGRTVRVRYSLPIRLNLQ